MSPIRKSMRFAHSDGHTSLCFERSGRFVLIDPCLDNVTASLRILKCPFRCNRYLLTCGSDGDVRIWDGLEDGNPKSIDVGDITYAVAIHV